MHAAFQNSCPWDLCETCVPVLEYWAMLVLRAFGMEMLYHIVFAKLHIYTVGVFTEIPYKFYICDLSHSYFSFSLCLDGLSKRCFLLILIFQLITEVVTCEDSLNPLKATCTLMNCFLVMWVGKCLEMHTCAEVFAVVTPAWAARSQRYEMQLGLQCKLLG